MTTASVPLRTLRRRRAIASWLVVGLALAGCGGGRSTGDPSDPAKGTVQVLSISSRAAAATYVLNVYVPPPSAGHPRDLPVVYALDGESWFQTLVGISEAAREPAIVVAVHTAGLRNRDFVPVNSCTPGGGGQATYLDFVRQELIPTIESTVGGDPARRILFGHSHGGSFVLYALFSEPATRHSFAAYLASDSSIGCLGDTASRWEQAYAEASTTLPVRLHLSYATQGAYQANLAYAEVLARRPYGGFLFRAREYSGTHSGIVPQALEDGIGFALGR